MALNFQNSETTSLSRVLLIACLVISVVLATVYAREGEEGPIHTVQGAVSAVSAPFKFAGASAAAGVDGAATSVEDATADESTLSGLREQVAELTALVAQDEELRQENERLQGLLDIQKSFDVTGVPARVIGRSTDAWNQTVTLDEGEDAGIDTGLTVMGATGVVGQVISTTKNTSTVRLLTDSSSGAAAIIQSNRAEGIVRGSLSGLLYLQSVDADVAVSVGDLVLTSGLGGSYVRGLLIGTVVKVEGSQGDATRTIVVSPNDEVGVLEDVIVVSSDVVSGSSGGASS